MIGNGDWLIAEFPRFLSWLLRDAFVAPSLNRLNVEARVVFIRVI